MTDHLARLQSALDRSVGGYSVEDVMAEVATGHMQLWMGENATAVTQIVTMPRKKVCQIFLAAGDYDELAKMEIDAANWARAQGCQSMMQSGRRGWTRRLGGDWREAFTVMERML
jgi:hypothetical protein